MRKFFLPLVAALAALTFAPVEAAGEKVAVLPAAVINGAAGNGPVVTEALRSSLRGKGFKIIDAAVVDRAIASTGMDLSRPQTLSSLSAFRKKVGADYVVYPRVLSVGQGVNTMEYQANILVNVMGPWAKGFAHTRQVGQVFKAEASRADRAVIGRSDAENAVSKLMQGFYAKVK
jgi:hypothetical protein